MERMWNYLMQGTLQKWNQTFNRKSPFWKMPTHTTINPMAFTVVSNNKICNGRPLLGIRTRVDSENIRGYHTCGALLQCCMPTINAPVEQGEITEHAVEMRGLPYDAKHSDVVEFFSPINVTRVELTTLSNGISGVGVAYFKSAEDLKDAIKMHLKYIGFRYIELKVCHYKQQDKMAGKETEYSILLCGLPLSASTVDVSKFFHPLQAAYVKLLRNSNGWLTGKSVVFFYNAEDAQKALNKNFFPMGNKFIEVHQRKEGMKVNKTLSGSGQSVFSIMTTETTIHPMVSRVLSNNKSWMGRLPFGMRIPSDSENIRGYHTCGELLQYRTHKLNTNISRIGLLIRKLSKL